ncbi:MAG: OmpA family protein [Saprospiraceae bacterium]|nr:OmpA family protein [Saprospiraceae bacterium]
MKFSVLILFSLVVFYEAFAQESIQTITVENYTKFDQDEAVRAICIDRNNYKWLGTDRGLYRVIGLDLEPEKFSNDSILAITEDKKGVIWYANRNQQIKSLDPYHQIDIQVKGVQVTCLSYYKGDIWVGSSNGLFRVSDDQIKILNHYTSNNSKLKSNQINSLFPDSEGRLWVGTNEGVVIIKDKSWSHFEKENKINGAVSTSEGIWLLAEKKMWLIYKEEGRDRWQDAAVKRGLSQGPVRSIVSDSKGNIYIASEILVQFNPYTDQSTPIDKDYGFISSQTLSLSCDRNDDLWVGTADRGMFRVDVSLEGVSQLTAVAYARGELKCPGEKSSTITVIAKGGKTPYSFQWNIPGLNGNKIDSVGAGEYTVTITDAEGESYITSVSVRQPKEIKSTVVSKTRVSELNTKDGKAVIQVEGGTPPYRIIWDNGRTGTNGTNLSAGKHVVKIYDQNQCYQSTEVYIESPKAIPDLDRTKLAVGQTLRINQLYFTADSAIVSEESFPVLDEIYQFLLKNKDVSIEIGGHTNGIPPHEYCDRLSAARAKNVADYLYNNGIPFEQISHRGYGKREPIASNDTVAGRLRNQRVEIKIIAIAN